MKKRILVILAFGISFTPAVFAASKVGPVSMTRLLEESPGAAGCNLPVNAKDGLVAPRQIGQAGKASSAPVAGSAAAAR